MPMQTDVEDATLVHISVKKEDGDWAVRVFPSRPGDTIAFYNTKPAKKSPERPHKVVWVSHGLVNKMKLLVTEKGLSGLFKGFELTAGAGKDIHTDSPTGAGTWRYKIEFWEDPTANPVAQVTIDPDVIVHNDP